MARAPEIVLAELREQAAAREHWDMHKEPIFAEAADVIEQLLADASRTFDVLSMAVSALGNGHAGRHYVLRCEVCNTVHAQCRCFRVGEEKPVQWTRCGEHRDTHERKHDVRFGPKAAA